MRWGGPEFAVLDDPNGLPEKRVLYEKGKFDAAALIGHRHLWPGEDDDGPFHQCLASEPPAVGAAAKLGFFDSCTAGQGGSGCLIPLHFHKTGDALSTSTAVAQLSFQAVELNSLPEGHIAKVFAWIALHIPTFTHKPDHWHGISRKRRRTAPKRPHSGA